MNMNSSSSNSPSNSSSNFSTKRFVTKRLPFAIFLHASQKLRFVGLEPDANGNDVHFVFADPDGIADELEFAFERGEMASAISLFASQKFLRKKMTAVLEGRLEGREDDVNFNNRNNGVFYERKYR